MWKSNKNFIQTFIAILFELEKNAFFKIALEAQINVHFVCYIFREQGKFISGFLESVQYLFSSFLYAELFKKSQPASL